MAGLRLAALIPLLCLLTGCLMWWGKRYHLDFQLEAAGSRLEASEAKALSRGREAVGKGVVQWRDAEEREEHPELAAYQLGDETIAVSWSFTTNRMMMVLKNRSDQPLEILWPEAAVDLGSGAERLVPYSVMVPVEGSDGDEWEAPREACFVPPGGEAFYRVYPQSRLKPGFTYLRQDSFFAHKAGPFLLPSEGVLDGRVSHTQTREERQEVAAGLAGQQLRFTLPLIVGGERLDYQFEIKVKEAVVVGRIRAYA